MKYTILAIFFYGCMFTATSQIITYADYKTKNPGNEKERTFMLDLLRSAMKKEYKQDFVFVVNTFSVSSNGYAWLMASAERKDGQSIEFSKDIEDFVDCCHVECLFQKKGTQWAIVEQGSFSTDVWFDGIWERTKAPRQLFKAVFSN